MTIRFLGQDFFRSQYFAQRYLHGDQNEGVKYLGQRYFAARYFRASYLHGGGVPPTPTPGTRRLRTLMGVGL